MLLGRRCAGCRDGPSPEWGGRESNLKVAEDIKGFPFATTTMSKASQPELKKVLQVTLYLRLPC